jgi:hypothetical protein
VGEVDLPSVVGVQRSHLTPLRWREEVAVEVDVILVYSAVVLESERVKCMYEYDSRKLHAV